MLAKPAFLLSLIAEQLRESKPLDRFLVVALVRRNHARQRGRHFRPERNFAVPFVDKIVKLSDDFLAAFCGIKFKSFQRRAIIFTESVTTRHIAPMIKNVL